MRRIVPNKVFDWKRQKSQISVYTKNDERWEKNLA